jgi:hypothetical protein
VFFLINVESLLGCSPLTWNQESKHKEPLIANVGLKHEQIIIWRVKILATLLLLYFQIEQKGSMNKNGNLFLLNVLQWEIWRVNANLEGSFRFIFGKAKKKGSQWKGRKKREKKGRLSH